MTRLVLVAGSGLAREVLAVVTATGSHTVIGLLDDAPHLQHAHLQGVPVLGTLDDAGSFPAVQFLVCIGSGRGRESAVERLHAQGVSGDRFATVIDPTARIGSGSVVGAGSILLAGVVLTASVTVGRHVVAMPQVVLTHDDVVGDYATLAAGVRLGGAVHVGAAAYLGMGSTVRQHVCVGPGSTLGMAAALLDDLPAGETWVGVPARPLRTARPVAQSAPSFPVGAS
ncbi:acetyltransferase [Arthrobacter sp. Leaf234]|uniref:NeuD/PglB/VioB family sugar acetyltransferase n=1 Tax=Arthrobacter sp. Leaf234 TaxID=1736303 RepID=UPI0006FEF1CB|nr:NeuD/PglB/VioB family sugar acetyltransferase [Arthrobacter sp. Leaf234]KQO01829.1 acetyltransferase [Arthrobacter sp. Leaf234]